MKVILGFFLSLSLLPAGIIPDQYIVELETSPVAAQVSGRSDLRGTPAESHRSRLRTEQAAVERRMRSVNAQVLDRFDTVANALAVSAPGMTADELARIPGVRRVYADRTFHLMLDHALPVHKVPEAWNQVGIDKAGAGIKIAIIDSGIDVDHPGFQDSTLAMPAGFPKVSAASDRDFTNNKVIVARNYVSGDADARDHAGHGTAAAMTAAGVRNSGPVATITGVAPKAWLGNYKIFGANGVSSGRLILRSIEDAVLDGMDVINMSLGSDAAPRPVDDPWVNAIDRAAALGVIVVVSAGNNGPDLNTMGSPATAASAIGVGASENDRSFASGVQLDTGNSYAALPGSGMPPTAPVSGPLADVAASDGNGLACQALPSGSLRGQIALILRGICTFQDKLTNAQQAGAIGGLIYTHSEQPDPAPWSAGTATLPAQMVSYAAGVEIKSKLAGGATILATMRFTLGPVYADPNRLAVFTAKGPGSDLAIKPDLVATGTNLYMATEKSDPQGIMYDASGYTVENGTSFSAPLVAGAAALIKAARPGLSAAQYRSLLINSAAPLVMANGSVPRAQQVGAGVLDVSAALRASAAVLPTSLSFGVGSADVSSAANLTLSNVGTADETFLLSVISRDGGPVLSLPLNSVQLPAGSSVRLNLTFSGSSLAPGQYEGLLVIQGARSGVESHVPYWYATPSGIGSRITKLAPSEVDSGASAELVFRITDSSGLAIMDKQPTVTAVSDGGRVVGQPQLIDSDVPGAFLVNVRVGARGPSVFRIQAGDLTQDITLLAK